MSTCCNACYYLSIDYSFSEVPSVTLVYKLVQAKLKVLGLDLMISPDKIPFGVTYRYMYPLQGFLDGPFVRLLD